MSEYKKMLEEICQEVLWIPSKLSILQEADYWYELDINFNVLKNMYLIDCDKISDKIK